MAIDPICQMTVDEETGLPAQYEGQTYYFCSPYCVEAFKKDPARFVKSATPAHVQEPSSQNELATDPVCGMTVDPNRAAGKTRV
jgi:Cu+-exporting ATPase